MLNVGVGCVSNI